MTAWPRPRPAERRRDWIAQRQELDGTWTTISAPASFPEAHRAYSRSLVEHPFAEVRVTQEEKR